MYKRLAATARAAKDIPCELCAQDFYLARGDVDAEETKDPKFRLVF